MPHSNQAKKRLRQNVKRKIQNRNVKSSMKTHVKKVLKAIDAKDVKTAKEELPKAMKKIDKAVKRNVIHKNQGSRRVARLSRNLHKLEKELSKEQPPQ